MKNYLLISLLLLFCTGMSAQQSNNKYIQEWEKLAAAERETLPQSATNIIDDILQKAISDKNNTQVIKALIYKNKYKKQIDRSYNEQIFSDLDSLISQTSNLGEKALLHSMLAELYSDYYNQNQWNIDNRTDLSDFVPEDMKVWSKNIFADKIVGHLDLSVADNETLKKHQTKEYDDIILLGADAKTYYPTLYDFLMYRAINIAESMNYQPFSTNIGSDIFNLAIPAKEYILLNLNTDIYRKIPVLSYYQQYLRDLLSRNMTATVIITDINKIMFLGNYLDAEQRVDAYERLSNMYESSEYNVLVIDQMVETIPRPYINLKNAQENKTRAYNLLKKGIEKYPGFSRIGLLQKRLQDMESPFLNIEGQPCYHPDDKIQLKVVHQNLQSLKDLQTLKLYVLNKDGNGYNLVKEYTEKYVSNKTYDTDTAYIDIPKLDVGKYCLSNLPVDSLNKLLRNEQEPIIDNEEGILENYYFKRNKSFEFSVSNMMSFFRNSAPDTYEIVVVDRKYGNPVKNASVEIYTYPTNYKDKSRLITTLKTNDKGIATYIDKTAKDKTVYRYYNARYKVKSGNDKFLGYTDMNASNYKWNWDYPNEPEPVINIFTDRSIYRPGQTVYFKAILLNDINKVAANEELTVELYNPNDDVVGEKDIITNEYGSISGEFVLPSTGLTGQYYIDIDGTEYYFRVEEYKRPTFEITFDKIDKSYTFGETVTLKGYARNFSGVNLQGATVAYNIMESPFSFWRMHSSRTTLFKEGNVTTNEDGSFEITFTPEERQGEKLWMINPSILNYDIIATITDMNGETQEGRHNVVVGKISMEIDLQIPEQLEKSTDYTISIVAKNLQGENIETTGNYTIYRLDDSDSIRSTVKTGSFKTGKQDGLLKEIKTKTSGKYRIEIKAMDSRNNEITAKKDFILFSYNDKRPPIKTNEWILRRKDTFSKDKPAEIIFGVTDKDIYVLYQLTSNEKTFEQRFEKLSNTNKKFIVPYKDEYGEQVNMTFTFVKDGKLYNNNVLLFKEKEAIDITLKLKFEVFRDKLRPGQEETWTLKIADKKDEAVSAEVLTSMYDISLDQLSAYKQWMMEYPYINTKSAYPINYDHYSLYNSDKKSSIDLPIKYRLYSIKPISLDLLDWFGYIYRENHSKYINYLNARSNEPVVFENRHGVAGQITGTVTDKEGNPIIGVSIKEVGNETNGTSSDLNGRFEINVQENAILEFSFIGYTTKQIRVTKATSLNITMHEDSLMMDEVTVVAYGSMTKKTLAGSAAGITVREAGTVSAYGELNELVVAVADTDAQMVATDDGAQPRAGNTTPQIRSNFNETAFFFPQLRTNEKGETLISFTVPESNTTWRFRVLAHDKDARTGALEQLVVTRKELMVIPNMPRFVRQGDKTSISTKIANLSDNAITGDVRIEFFDPITEKIIGLDIAGQKQTFSVGKGASTFASWTFDVPANIELLGCRIIAQNETFSDGEQHVLAVLPDRMLVTESMPIDITEAGTASFTLDKLYNNKSASIDNYKLTLEYASNPAWYAIQALPTMSNPSNENAVNWFASYYVNTLGSSIVRQYPKVGAMIQAWLKQGGDKETLISNLQKDEELKSVLLEETPWVLEAKDETEQMQRLSLLFDLNNTKQLTDAATRKLQELMNNSDNAWSWYKGFYPSRSITQYILYGYAKLQEVGQVEYPQEIKMMQMDALRFIDKRIAEDFTNLKKSNKNWENIQYVSTNQLEFAYVRSFYRDIPINQEARAAERFYTDVASRNWTKLNLYEQSILVEILKKNGEKALADKIIKSIKEHAVKDKLGMYWPNNRSNVFMSLSAISVHTFVMDALKGSTTEQEMNLMKQWLLNQKRTQVWESTHATIDAITAILNTGSDWFTGETNPVAITIGNERVEHENIELGTGYFKQTWNKSEISNNMAKVEVATTANEPAFGALYWQYYENMDKITEQRGDLNVEKQLYKEVVNAAGKSLTLVTENNPLKVGDKVIMRLTIRTDRDIEFVHLKDMRASCFEPQQTLSGTQWNGNLIYYQATKDASTNFYFDHLPKGTYVLEYPVYVNRTGKYANGITTIQCMYAPEFTSHTKGMRIIVNE